MSNMIKQFIGFSILAILGSVSTFGVPVQDTATGHWYDIIVAPPATSAQDSWNTSKTAAEASTHNGVSGHLATLTSENEYHFVDDLRVGIPSGPVWGEVWIGGSQQPLSSDNADGWTWVNGEGLISTFYWRSGEPNGFSGENHLAIGLWPRGAGGNWNDEGALGLITGYVIEYDVSVDVDPPTVPANLTGTAISSTEIDLTWDTSTEVGGSNVAGYKLFRDAVEIANLAGTTHSDTGLTSNTTYAYTVLAYDDATPANESAQSNPSTDVTTSILAENCSVSEEGCETIPGGGQTLTFPEGSIEPGDEITVTVDEIVDTRECAIGDVMGHTPNGPLQLFGGDGIPDNELNIPEYLCGSPNFIVVKVDSSELLISEGTVFVENDTATVLPGNLYICEEPIVQDPPNNDPQHQDVVVWQSTNPSEMRENGKGGGTVFEGTAGEFTHECGSSRARTMGASYFVVGMHIDFGVDWFGGDRDNAEFIALTRYKLTLLAESVEDARSDGALTKKGDYKKMRNMVANAIKNLDGGNFDDALDHAQNFIKFVDSANYATKPINYNGEHLMRGLNIEFMLRVKIIPFAP